MKRRELLGLTATAASFGVIAGCGSGGSGGSGGGGDGADGGATPTPTEGSGDGGGGGSGICDTARIPLTRAESVDDATVELGFRNQIGAAIQPVETIVTLNNGVKHETTFPEGTTVEDGGEFSAAVEMEAEPDSIFNIELVFRDENGECSLRASCPHQETVCLTGVI